MGTKWVVKVMSTELNDYLTFSLKDDFKPVSIGNVVPLFIDISLVAHKYFYYSKPATYYSFIEIFYRLALKKHQNSQLATSPFLVIPEKEYTLKLAQDVKSFLFTAGRFTWVIFLEDKNIIDLLKLLWHHISIRHFDVTSIINTFKGLITQSLQVMELKA